jgi:hypothetical protein
MVLEHACAIAKDELLATADATSGTEFLSSHDTDVGNLPSKRRQVV